MQLMIFKTRENARPSSRFSYYATSGLLFIDFNLRGNSLHFFCAKVEALKRSKEEEEEGRGGQGKRGNLFLLLSSQLSRGTCAETVTTQAMSAMLTCLR